MAAFKRRIAALDAERIAEVNKSRQARGPVEVHAWMRDRLAIRSQRRRAECNAATDAECLQADVDNKIVFWTMLRRSRDQEGEQ